MSTLVPSLIRTYVPIAVGLIVGWLGAAGVILPEGASDSLVLGLTGVATAIYYFVVRFLEQKYPQLGWFLGLAAQPTYDPPASE